MSIEFFSQVTSDLIVFLPSYYSENVYPDVSSKVVYTAVRLHLIFQYVSCMKLLFRASEYSGVVKRKKAKFYNLFRSPFPIRME